MKVTFIFKGKFIAPFEKRPHDPCLKENNKHNSAKVEQYAD